MARIRTIKPEFWSSEQVMECSLPARLLFIGLWNFCDDAGRMPFRPRQIKAQVFPGDDMTPDAVLGLLDELSSNGLIRRYAVDGDDYLMVTGWHHQKIDRPQKSKCPGPIDDNSSNDRRTFVPDSKGKEGSVAEPSRAAPDGYSVWELWQSRRVHHGHGTDAAPPAPKAIQTAQAWLDAGATMKLIQQAFDAALGRKGAEPPRSLAYCDGAIRDAMKVKPMEARRRMTHEEIRAGRIKSYQQTGFWDASWGPRPEVAA